MPLRYLVAVAGLVVAAIAASIWYSGGAPDPLPLMFDTPAASQGSSITVHIAGEVAQPGLVEIARGARVADAVAAAGGSTRDAELSSVNLAAELRDGEQIVIPGPSSPAGVAAVTADGMVRINLASTSELERLPGVGPVLAARISSYRDEHGPFASVEDLLDVPGIGEGKLEGLRDAVALP